jgi:adenylate cyclase
MAPDNNQYTFFHIDNGKEHEPYKQNIGSKTFYNLAHGTHTFKVKGENNDGIGSDNEDLIQIKISPPFYLDYRFMIPLTLLAFGLIYAVYTLRVYQIKQENIKLEALVQIRTKELFAEKETSERLLLNILPKNIAERLKNGESNIADSFAQVTILFADIVGFTKLSQTVNPWELVSKLNDLFSRFDKISVDLKVEKIKTIGDCYMVVAGLPEITSDHASTMIEVAKQMLSAIEDFNKTYQTTLAIRIGINTGEVVAGVIGTHKFIYDLWGDSVNTASRMESHGVPGRIHVTESTYKMVKDKYQFESRGVMEIKGKGKMETYLLTT